MPFVAGFALQIPFVDVVLFFGFYSLLEGIVGVRFVGFLFACVFEVWLTSLPLPCNPRPLSRR